MLEAVLLLASSSSSLARRKNQVTTRTAETSVWGRLRSGTTKGYPVPVSQRRASYASHDAAIMRAWW